MSGALLRTGNLQEFKALGVDGQPVYSAALQLREAIRLKMGREASSCLAIPQPNETGDRIDWYAPAEGDVIPWSAATVEERADAYAQLEVMHAKLGATSESMRADAQNREKQIFGRLLKKPFTFPTATMSTWSMASPSSPSGGSPITREPMITTRCCVCVRLCPALRQ